MIWRMSEHTLGLSPNTEVKSVFVKYPEYSTWSQQSNEHDFEYELSEPWWSRCFINIKQMAVTMTTKEVPSVCVCGGGAGNRWRALTPELALCGPEEGCGCWLLPQLINQLSGLWTVRTCWRKCQSVFPRRRLQESCFVHNPKIFDFLSQRRKN